MIQKALKRRVVWRGWIVCIFVLVGLSGCSTVQKRVLATNPVEARVIRGLSIQGDADAASARLVRSDDQRLGTAERIAMILDAAKQSESGAVAGQEPEASIYRAAIRRLVDLMRDENFRSVDLGGGGGEPRLTVSDDSASTIDPLGPAELIPADQVLIGGLGERAIAKGMGLPFVAWSPRGDPMWARQPGVPTSGMSIPVTAVLLFDGAGARLEFIRTLRKPDCVLDGRRVRLAADFSAPLAYTLARGPNRALDIGALIFTDRNIGRSGLFQFQPYDPSKIPVVFVHGLLSRPETWARATNALIADPDIRSRYQFWYFQYPTGLPVWRTAANLRSELDRYDRELGRVSIDKVLIGHSMGGLVCSLLVRDGGQKLWGQFSDVPLADVELDAGARAALNELVNFRARPDVSRVIFVATPHRGSPMALRPGASLAASMVRLPLGPLQRELGRIVEFLSDDARRHFRAPANSLRFLRANSQLVTSALELPVRDGIEMHSVIGDRGRRGPLELSSDGVVPYWSAHLSDAESETIVPSGHGANEHVDGVEAIRRILITR